MWEPEGHKRARIVREREKERCESHSRREEKEVLEEEGVEEEEDEEGSTTETTEATGWAGRLQRDLSDIAGMNEFAHPPVHDPKGSDM